MGKLWSLEFLRIILLLFVFADHGFYELIGRKGFDGIWSNGVTAVNGFLVVSGYLLYRTAKSKNAPTFKGFFVKQWLRLAPVAIAVAIIGIVLFKIAKFGYDIDVLPSCFLLVFRSSGVISPTPAFYVVMWYVGALFWCGLLLFYMLQNFDMKKNLFAFALIIYFGLVFPVGPNFYTIIKESFRTYFFRAFAAMCLGAVVAHICTTCKPYRKLWARICFTVLEVACIFYLCWGSSRGNMPIIDSLPIIGKFNFMRSGMPETNFYSYLFFAVFVFLFAQNAGFISTFLNRQRWIQHVSRYGYSFLVTMGLAFLITGRFHTESFFALLAVNIALAVAVYWAVEYWAIKLANKYRNVVSSKDTEG